MHRTVLWRMWPNHLLHRCDVLLLTIFQRTLHARQSIIRPRGLVSPVVIYTFLLIAGLGLFRLLREEVVENRSIFLELIIWYTETARRSYLVDVNDDDGTRAWNHIDLVRADVRFELRRAVLEDATCYFLDAHLLTMN